ncbi:MAG: ATP-dependent Clp protease adapter ClpS [Actinomycetes bacterium]
MSSVKHERSTSTATLSQDEVVTEKSWNVVVWDDPVTPMPVVALIFRKIFGYSNNKATQLMMTVHHQGRAIVWSGVRERAEGYCIKLQANGLLSTVEQDS